METFCPCYSLRQSGRRKPRASTGPRGAARVADPGACPAEASRGTRASCSWASSSTPNGFLEANTDGVRVRWCWTRWPNTLPGRSLLESARACSCSTWRPVRARTRWRCSNSPVASPRRRRNMRQVGEGCIFASAILLSGRSGRWACTRSRRDTARNFSATDWTCAVRTATSWSRPAARCEPTGGSIGRLPAGAAWLLGCLRAASSGEPLF
jgi:hypothetical protein